MGVLSSLIKTVVDTAIKPAIKTVSRVVTEEIPKAAAKAAARGTVRSGIKRTVKTAAKTASKKAKTILNAEKLNKTAKDIKNAIKDVKNIIETIKDPVGTLKDKVTSGVKNLVEGKNKKEQTLSNEAEQTLSNEVEETLSKEAEEDIYEDLQDQFFQGQGYEENIRRVKKQMSETERKRTSKATQTPGRKVEEIFKTDEDIEREKREYKDEDADDPFIRWYDIPYYIRQKIEDVAAMKSGGGSEDPLIRELVENGWTGARLSHIIDFCYRWNVDIPDEW